ncbi:MAG: hypothetical protein HFH68_09515 [Lachnospiraceae bacterium]|nr:hypothetical protein [Lachnospiraceae bacterium]
MAILEAIMVIIGLGAVFLSFRVADGNSTNTSTSSTSGEELKNVTDKAKEFLDKFNEDIESKAEEVLNNTDNKLGTILNEKIMGLSEYSDQILDKMEKNHSETVFLYDMLNEKEKEIKELVHDIDVIKAGIRDELAKEYQEHKKRFEETGSSKVQTSIPVYNNDSLPDELYGISANPASTSTEDTIQESIISMPGMEIPEKDGNDINTSMYDVEIARIEEQEIWEKSLRRLYGNMGVSDIEAAAIEAGIDHVDHSDEIISLYKKGCSILEISKMLDIGQGEVKFVIDMYKAS